MSLRRQNLGKTVRCIRSGVTVFAALYPSFNKTNQTSFQLPFFAKEVRDVGRFEELIAITYEVVTRCYIAHMSVIDRS